MAFIKDPVAFKKAAKEFARIMFVTVVGAALAGAAVLAGFITEPLTFAVVTAVLGSIGKAWDKYVHESDTTTKTGIVPF